MLFNSIEFAFFLPLVFLGYWFIFGKNHVHQNFYLITCSYLFYGWWDIRFLFLMIFSSLVDYFFSRAIFSNSDQQKRKILLWTCLGINIGLLSVFKYFNFFTENFAAAFTFFGAHINIAHLTIVLPLGISFYTFQSMSYTIDVYRNKLKPAKSLPLYLSFVSFFPQLVAGPIERAGKMLPQFGSARTFDTLQAGDGMRRMLWGFFKKLVIADNCALIVDRIFDSQAHNSGSTYLLGAFLFSFQIYCDFSGYSDIAIGCAKLFGFELSQNFRFPFFSRSIPEFWKRWHITMTNWFRDYVYLSLFRGQESKRLRMRNTLIVFLLIGLWHGARWNFLFYGLLQFIYFIPQLLRKANALSRKIQHTTSLLSDRLRIIGTFSLVVLSGIFFRSLTTKQAFTAFSTIFSPTLFAKPAFLYKWTWLTLALIAVMVVIEWIQKDQRHGLDLSGRSVRRPIRYLIYFLLLLCIFLFKGPKNDFIYQQF